MKFLNIIQNLTKEEFKQFRLFLSSPFHNTDPNLLKLYKALEKHHRDLTNRSLSKEKIFKKVFPKHQWDDGKWRNLTAKMVKVLHQFLVATEIKNHPLEAEKLRVRALSKRDLYPMFKKAFHVLDQSLTQQISSNQQALLDKIMLGQLYYYHPQTDKRTNLHYLELAVRETGILYESLDQKTKLERMIHLQILKPEEQPLKPLKQPVYLKLYQLFLQLQQSRDHATFILTKEYFTDILKDLSIQDQKFGLFHLINFAIRQYNLGKATYDTIIFELYTMGLQNDILTENGRLTEATFHNIIGAGLTLKKYAWAADFIQQADTYLSPKIRENAKTYALGSMYFRQKNYSKTIETINNFQHDNLLSNLIVKTMLLRSYFESFLIDPSYYDMFINYTIAFERLIKRKKNLPQERKTGCINLSNMLRKIAKSIAEKSWNASVKITYQANVESMQHLIGKKWLTEKLKEL